MNTQESDSQKKSQQVSHLMRLNKFLASAGLGSRRKCEEFILEGRIAVDQEEICDLATMVDPEKQQITLDGEIVRGKPKRYYLLNKPAGYLCTHRDPQGRPRAIDLVPDGEELFTVGRLDESSQGLLIITNDGDLANKLAHPRYQVLRTYRVQVAGEPDKDALNFIRKGIHFSEGFFRVHRVRKMKSQGKSTFLEIDLKQGQNREIRRLLARVGHKVMYLQRIAFGPFRLGKLNVGSFRDLSRDDIDELLKTSFRKRGRKPGRSGTPKRTASKAGKTRTSRKTSASRKNQSKKSSQRKGRKRRIPSTGRSGARTKTRRSRGRK